jgi:hypothetical protein
VTFDLHDALVALGIATGASAWLGQRCREWLDAPSTPNLDNYQRMIKYWEQVYSKEFTMHVTKQTEIVGVTITLGKDEVKQLVNLLYKSRDYDYHFREPTPVSDFAERLIKELS